MIVVAGFLGALTGGGSFTRWVGVIFAESVARALLALPDFRMT
ncbi:MAG TPA: hypothetical protein VFN62_02670 [Acidobacteriaceae bacterium]|nr:hypothetical protein [Acidobacteriaceae bacterium]